MIQGSGRSKVLLAGLLVTLLATALMAPATAAETAAGSEASPDGDAPEGSGAAPGDGSNTPAANNATTHPDDISTTHPGVTLVPISYHPYPDAADPLGIPYYSFGDQSFDYFVGTYAFLDQDRNGFDFPSVVVDGHILLEGTFGGTYENTLAAYRDAFDDRAPLESPLTLTVDSDGAGQDRTVRIHVEASSPLDEPRLRLHWAVLEDDVPFRPPPALSNGVFVHRFTTRDISPMPLQPVTLDGDGRFTSQLQLALDPAWDADKLSLAVWVQNHAASGSRFATMEILQATLHPLDAPGTTVQDRKAVVMEMYTATWCYTCLFGDHALDTLATEQGLASSEYREPQWRYLRTPQWAPLALGALAGIAVALLVLRPPRGGLTA